MISASDLDRRITVERNSGEAVDEYNEPIIVWALLSHLWAKRVDVKDGEALAAGQVAGSVKTRFTIRNSTLAAGILTSDRIQHAGKIWQISGIKEAPNGPRDAFIEITASSELD